MTAVPITPQDSQFYETVRPFALMAVVAFVLGFAGYVALGRPAIAQPKPSAAAAVAAEPAVAAPASADWNFPKHI